MTQAHKRLADRLGKNPALLDKVKQALAGGNAPLWVLNVFEEESFVREVLEMMARR